MIFNTLTKLYKADYGIQILEHSFPLWGREKFLLFFLLVLLD